MCSGCYAMPSAGPGRARASSCTKSAFATTTGGREWSHSRPSAVLRTTARLASPFCFPRRTDMKIKPTSIDYHRNGIGGAPFNVVLFHDGDSEKVAIVFERPGDCAVLDVT